MSMQYKNPNTVPSSVDQNGGTQVNTFYWDKKALVESRDEQFFMPLADVTSMPKHYGKEIKKYHYIPLLDDENINDQGIDANGVSIVDGNLYGSSKDVGTITAALPMLTENGGRVNRVGFTRKVLTGRIDKFGFFFEFTKEALDFDSDSELYGHLSRELMNGAIKLTEAVLQKDLLAGAGVVVYTGDAQTDDDITGEGTEVSEVTYSDLMRLSIILDENKTSKQTKVITGSRMIDTKTISAGRVAYIGSELIPTLRKMKGLHDEPAFIPVHQYGAAGTILNGEIGTIDAFRFVVVPEMLHWAGAGATATSANKGYRTSIVDVGGTPTEKYNVYPILVVGNESFTTIGFQTDGKTVKFDITTKMPGKETASWHDPYGETGFSSIKWYYGCMILRSERLAVIKTVAPL